MTTSVPVSVVSVWDNKKARSLCWTLNNWVQTDIEILQAVCLNDPPKYLIYGFEIAPTTGTRHLQGYIAWNNPRSVSKFISLFHTKGVHIEKTRGTPVQASDYCKYADYPTNSIVNEFYQFGELPVQGDRVDWAIALNSLTDNEVVDVIDVQPHLLPNIRALERYKTLKMKPIHRDVKVIVLYGDAGTGKTRYAYDKFSDIYSKPRGDWWDGYSGQKTVLLDDYYGYLPYCELLRVLDRYPYQVPVKGSYVYAQWDTVVITSNKPPNLWYSQGLTPALKRRLNEIYYVSFIDGETHYDLISPTPPTHSPQETLDDA